MADQPTTPDSSFPAAGQKASADSAAPVASGNQSPDTFIGGPMPQPPVDPKKKNTGLVVGGLLAVGIAIAILAGLFFTGVFGGSSKVASYNDFKKGVQEAAVGSGASVCADSADTVLGSAFDETRQQGATELGVTPEDISIYLCSSADLNSLEGVASLDSSSSLVVSFYINGASIDKGQVDDFSQSDFEDAWVVYGENWMAVGTNGEEGLKAKLIDTFNGTEVTSK